MNNIIRNKTSSNHYMLDALDYRMNTILGLVIAKSVVLIMIRSKLSIIISRYIKLYRQNLYHHLPCNYKTLDCEQFSRKACEMFCRELNVFLK